MIKTETMKRYEKETGGIAKFIEEAKRYRDDPTLLNNIIEAMGEKIDELQAKAEAYDRLMSGGKKTLKEWANIFGKPIVVDSDDTILVFSSVPRYDVGYNQEGEFIDDWIGEVIAHIDCEYEGEYVDDVTLPDGWEEK